MPDLDNRTPTLTGVTNWQIHRAQLTVARGSRGAEDCRELLGMCGLLPNQPPPRSSRKPKHAGGSDVRA